MNRTLNEYFHFLWKYKSMKRRLVRLHKANRNQRRQQILVKNLSKLKLKLENLVKTLKLSAAATGLAVSAMLLSPSKSDAQISFGPPQINPFGLTDIGNYSWPTFVDLDADGDFDLFAAGNVIGDFSYFQNTGTISSPAFAPRVLSPFGLGYAFSDWADPTFVDIDNDGDFDFFYANYPSQIVFHQNTGTPSSPSFAASTVNPFGLSSIPTLNGNIDFVDIDNDGDMDLFASGDNGSLYYYQNTGTSGSPAFAAPVTNPFGLNPVGFSNGSPEFVDIDADGDFDLFYGEFLGRFLVFENSGTSSSPAFLAPQINPFNLTNAFTYLSSPAFADLDNDGDMDLLTGEGYGRFGFFENTSVLTPPCNVIDQNLTVDDNLVCYNTPATISIASSENGLDYYLRNDADNSIVHGPVTGNGSSLSFPTPNLTSSATFNVYATEVPLSGVDLPGTDDLVRFSSPFHAFTNEITVEAWVNFNGTHLRAGQSTQGSDNMLTNVWLWDFGTWYVNDNGNWRSLPFPATIPTGWTKVTTVADASGMAIYYNGNLVASNSNGISSGIRFNSGAVLELGHDPRFAPTIRNTNNSFDNFSVWNIAKTAQDVQDELQACLTGTETGLVLANKMNEGTGSTLNSLFGSNASIINPSPGNWILGSSYCNDACTLEMSQTITVNVLPELLGVNNSTICNEESLIINGTTYGASNPTGTEVFTNVGPNGCDSTVTINLVVLPALSGVNNTTICNEESLVINGTTYNAANPTGTEVFTNVGPNGCDSTVTVSLNVLPALTGSNTTTICNDESIVINGTTYDASNPSGTEVFAGVGPNGCDSTVTISLNVLPAVDVTTSTSNETITANLSGATYQWLDCDNSNAPISGETDQSFTATANGNYAVEITENGCVAVSACVSILSTNILLVDNDGLISIYPNPTNGMVIIDLPENLSGSVLELTNSLGQVLLSDRINSSRRIIELGNFSNGIYFINVRSENSVISQKIIKH